MNTIAQITLQGDSSFSVPSVEGCSAVFAPCLDPNCERPCGARRAIPLIEIVDPPVIRGVKAFLIAAILTIGIIGGIYGNHAVGRQDSAYQSARN